MTYLLSRICFVYVRPPSIVFIPEVHTSFAVREVHFIENRRFLYLYRTGLGSTDSLGMIMVALCNRADNYIFAL